MSSNLIVRKFVKRKCHLVAMSKTIICIHKDNTCDGRYLKFFTFGQTVKQNKMSTSKPVSLLGFFEATRICTKKPKMNKSATSYKDRRERKVKGHWSKGYTSCILKIFFIFCTYWKNVIYTCRYILMRVGMLGVGSLGHKPVRSFECACSSRLFMLRKAHKQVPRG